jgi:hypothetical protein
VCEAPRSAGGSVRSWSVTLIIAMVIRIKVSLGQHRAVRCGGRLISRPVVCRRCGRELPAGLLQQHFLIRNASDGNQTSSPDVDPDVPMCKAVGIDHGFACARRRRCRWQQRLCSRDIDDGAEVNAHPHRVCAPRVHCGRGTTGDSLLQSSFD